MARCLGREGEGEVGELGEIVGGGGKVKMGGRVLWQVSFGGGLREAMLPLPLPLSPLVTVTLSNAMALLNGTPPCSHRHGNPTKKCGGVNSKLRRMAVARAVLHRCQPKSTKVSSRASIFFFMEVSVFLELGVSTTTVPAPPVSFAASAAVVDESDVVAAGAGAGAGAGSRQSRAKISPSLK